jgi:hypothetical protein
VLGLWYLRHPAVVERRRVNRRERDELRALRQIRREVHRLEGRREKLEAGRQRRRDEHALRMRAEQERVQGRCDRIRAQFAELHGLLEMEVRAIKAEEASRLAALLERLQDGHAAGVRRAHRVWELSELHLWERAFLWLRGIRTASHLSEGGIDALHLDGKAAAAVLRWRLAVDAEVRRTMPKEVPPQQRIPLQERYARTRRKVEADRLRLQVEESALLTAVLEVFAERSAAWRTRTQGVDSWYEEQYAALDRAIEEARRPEPVHHWRLAEARRELDRFQEVTLRRYALSLVGL